MTDETNNFSACDMATAAAQGFRDGVASGRPVPPAAAVVPQCLQHFLDHKFTQLPVFEDGRTPLYLTEEQYSAIRSLLARLNPAPTPEPASPWIRVEDRLPESGRTVLAFYLNSHGKGRRIRAMFVKRWTVEAEEFADPDAQCCEYSEQDDCYYTTEGWYELIDNWPDYASCAVIEGVITHWMPLPAAPEQPAKEQDQ